MTLCDDAPARRFRRRIRRRRLTENDNNGTQEEDYPQGEDDDPQVEDEEGWSGESEYPVRDLCCYMDNCDEGYDCSRPRYGNCW